MNAMKLASRTLIVGLLVLALPAPSRAEEGALDAATVLQRVLDAHGARSAGTPWAA